MRHPLDERAQDLHWQIEDAVRAGKSAVSVVPLMQEAARAYEDAAQRRFDDGDAFGWSDVYAAITWWARSDETLEVKRVIAKALARAEQLTEGRDEVIAEIESLRKWAGA